MTTIATELAARIRAFSYDSLPKAAVEWAKMGIPDTVGVTLAGSLEPCARIGRCRFYLQAASGPRRSLVNFARPSASACGARLVWRKSMFRRFLIGMVSTLALTLSATANAETVVRIGMTAADIPRTLGQPDQGFEGNRFTGNTMYEGLTTWDLSSAAVRGPSRGASWLEPGRLDQPTKASPSHFLRTATRLS